MDYLIEPSPAHVYEVTAAQLEAIISASFQIPSYDIASYYRATRDCRGTSGIHIEYAERRTIKQVCEWYVDAVQNFVQGTQSHINPECNPLHLFEILRILASFEIIPEGYYVITIPTNEV